MLVSDGLAKNHHAAAAWILTTETHYSAGNFISGCVKIPGTKSDSHRAECFGILGVLLLLVQYADLWQLDLLSLKVCFGCDNQSALGYSFTNQCSITANTPDFDVLANTRTLLKQHQFSPLWRHVKGHQTGSDIDIWARLNNFADTLAGRTRINDNLPSPPPNILIRDEKWHVYVDGTKITTNFASTLFEGCTRHSVQDVWHRYHRVDTNHFDCVDWDAMEAAMHESRIAEQHWISKRAARDCS
jgi:hypothetical protein